MRGRKPKPSKLKVLYGNPGKRAIKQEPEPEVEIPDCPAHLDEEAQAEWARITPYLELHGLISHMDRAALAGYCMAYGRWVRAERVLKTTGDVVKAKGTGTPYQNPYLSVSNRALKQMREFLVEFGLTPSSRVRLGIAPSEPMDEFDKFFAGSG